MEAPMRSRILITSLLATGLLVVGSVAPAYAAPRASEGQGTPDVGVRQEVTDHAGTPGMAKMHEQMMKKMADKTGMTDMTKMGGMTDMTKMGDMTDMTKMGPMMKAHHADPRATTKHTHASTDQRS
jgi:hypothetical protein